MKVVKKTVYDRLVTNVEKRRHRQIRLREKN